jgi:hypothetical protein
MLPMMVRCRSGEARRAAHTGVGMRRTTRAFVVWLLALALPVQGLASATMLHCEQGHKNAAPHASHHPCESAAPAHHEDGVQVVASEAATAPIAAHGDASVDGVKARAHKCSACAACDVGATLPSAALTLPVPTAKAAAATLSEVVHATFLTAGLERPPRSLTA